MRAPQGIKPIAEQLLKMINGELGLKPFIEDGKAVEETI